MTNQSYYVMYADILKEIINSAGDKDAVKNL